MKKITVGMCTFDDFDGVYFTVQSLRMYQKKVNEIEILVVDNNPYSQSGETTKCFIDSIGGKYVPYSAKNSTSVRNEVFKHASGEYTLCLDCHVLLDSYFIFNLIKYYSNYKNCKDIISGPLCSDSLVPYATQFDPVWSNSMYGKWGFDKEKYEAGKPFETIMMGLGAFSCKTSNWVGFNENFVGFGGEEGYIHEKFRKNGGKSICVPQLKWIHRFGRPNGPKYSVKIEDRIWNYFIGWLEITKNPNHYMIKGIKSYFSETLQDNDKVENIFIEAKNFYKL